MADKTIQTADSMPNDPLSPDVRRLLLNKLPDIWSCAKEEVLPLLDAAPDVCNRLAHAFEEVAHGGASVPNGIPKRGSREWLRHTMTSLPLKHVFVYSDDALSIKPTSDASLRYLLLSFMPEQKVVTDKGVLNRELLCRALFEQLSEEGQALYASIAEWRPDIGLSDEYSLQGDVAIAKYVHLVETLFSRRYAALEKDLRAGLKLPGYRPTPSHYIAHLAKGAQVQVRERLDRYAALVPHDAGTPDDILVVVLSHMAANRVLLESACRDELTKLAVGACSSLLRAMNDVGVEEVPPLESDAEIRSCLKDWFGSKGSVILATEWDVLSDDSIDIALEHATTAQDIYRRTRGARGVEAEPEAFNTPCDRLIFCLALVACHYGNVLVRHELVGEPEYPVFPTRGERLRENPLSPNALEIVLTIFGQIAMSNTAGRLRADAVDEYAHATSVRRGHFQSLIFHVFKRWTAPQLLAVQAGFESDLREALAEAGLPESGV